MTAIVVRSACWFQKRGTRSPAECVDCYCGCAVGGALCTTHLGCAAGVHTVLMLPSPPI